MSNPETMLKWCERWLVVMGRDGVVRRWLAPPRMRGLFGRQNRKGTAMTDEHPVEVLVNRLRANSRFYEVVIFAWPFAASCVGRYDKARAEEAADRFRKALGLPRPVSRAEALAAVDGVLERAEGEREEQAAREGKCADEPGEAECGGVCILCGSAEAGVAATRLWLVEGNQVGLCEDCYRAVVRSKILP